MSNVPEYIQTDVRSLVRETRSYALLNTDKQALARSRAQRQRAREYQKTQEEVKALRELVQTMQARMDELFTRLK
jgi:hypothetical protein